ALVPSNCPDRSKLWQNSHEFAAALSGLPRGCFVRPERNAAWTFRVRISSFLRPAAVVPDRARSGPYRFWPGSIEPAEARCEHPTESAGRLLPCLLLMSGGP